MNFFFTCLPPCPGLMFLEGSGGGLLESTSSSGRRLNFCSGPIVGVGSADVFIFCTDGFTSVSE